MLFRSPASSVGLRRYRAVLSGQAEVAGLAPQVQLRLLPRWYPSDRCLSSLFDEGVYSARPHRFLAVVLVLSLHLPPRWPKRVGPEWRVMTGCPALSMTEVCAQWLLAYCCPCLGGRCAASVLAELVQFIPAGKSFCQLLFQLALLRLCSADLRRVTLVKIWVRHAGLYRI